MDLKQKHGCSIGDCENTYNTYYNGGPFKGCNGLKEVIFEKGSTEVACNLFDSCTGIEEVILSDAVTIIVQRMMNSYSDWILNMHGL